jgi:hypothetical protein
MNKDTFVEHDGKKFLRMKTDGPGGIIAIPTKLEAMNQAHSKGQHRIKAS